MSGIEVAGLALGAVSLVLQATDRYNAIGSRITRSVHKRKELQKKHGAITTWLALIFFRDALEIVERVEQQHILSADEKQVTAFMETFSSSFSMTGVVVRVLYPHCETACSSSVWVYTLVVFIQDASFHPLTH